MADLKSPLPNCPGHVTVPDFLTATHVTRWINREEEIPEHFETENVPVVFWQFFARFEMFDFHLDGLKKFDPADLDSYPAQLAFWLVEETNELVNQGINKKN